MDDDLAIWSLFYVCNLHSLFFRLYWWDLDIFGINIDEFKKVFTARICGINTRWSESFLLELSIEIGYIDILDGRAARNLRLGRSKDVFLAVDELASQAVWAVSVLSVLFALFGFVLGRYVALYHNLLFSMGE